MLPSLTSDTHFLTPSGRALCARGFFSLEGVKSRFSDQIPKVTKVKAREGPKSPKHTRLLKSACIAKSSQICRRSES